MSGDLTSTQGVVALAAGAVGLIALALAIVSAIKLRTIRRAQKIVLGDTGERDLARHAAAIQDGFVALRDLVESTFAAAEHRLAEHDRRLDRGVSHTAVVRYDAYGEMSGRQSSSMALLDEHGSGLVLSSILHREQARMYVKDVYEGKSSFELSPEEHEAIAAAMRSREVPASVGNPERVSSKS